MGATRTQRSAPINQPTAPNRGRFSYPSIASAFGALIVAWGFYLGSRDLFDNSFFTHLATGRLIVETGSVPSADPYSYTAPGAPWVVQSWFASLVYGGMERLGGGAALRALGGFLGAAVSLCIWMLTRPAKVLTFRIGISLLPLVLGVTMWSTRPLMFGLAFLGITLLALEGRITPIALVPTYWLWANTHGSFPLGLLAIVSVLLGRRCDRESTAVERSVLLWAAVGTATSVISPLGLNSLLFPFDLLQKSDLLQNVIEWQSPKFSDSFTRVFLLQALLAVVIVMRRPSWRATIPTVVFFALGLYAVRNIAVTSLVLVPIMARSAPPLGSVDGRERGPVPAALFAIVVAVGIVGNAAVLRGPAYDLHTYPVEALAFINANARVEDPQCRLLTKDSIGNLLHLLPLHDRTPVFLDDRYDMYPREITTDYLQLHGAGSEWREVLDLYQVQHVLWGRGDPFANLLVESSEWQLTYSDNAWVHIVRRDTWETCRRA